MANETLYRNGTVLTVDAENSVAEAVAIRGDRITAVGSAEKVRAAVGGDAEEVDLAGATMIPGFVDAHSHVAMVGQLSLHQANLNSPPIGDIKNIDGLVARLRERAEVEASDWVVGMGYDDTLLGEGRHPTRQDLDRVSLERPVVARHISGHLMAANSAALARAGIDRNSEAPEGGVIRRDERGEPNGVFEESAMFSLLGNVPGRSDDDRLAAIEHGAEQYARSGITTAQNGFTARVELQDFDRAFALGRIPIRVVVWPGFGVMRRLLDGRLSVQTPEEWLTLGAVKLFADGSIQGYTGHLCEPYHVAFQGQQEYRGYAAMSREELVRQVTAIYAAGMQVAVHTNGDAAIDDLLHAVEQASTAHPRADARPISVHAQMAREDQLDTMQRLGVVPSFFCLHTYYWGDRHRDVFLGPERARRISPARSAADRGMRFTIHTDAPVVPMDPLLLLWAAVNRETTGGVALGPEQCLTPIEALRATTIDAAWQLRLEDSRGSIEPGKLADFAILDGNPLEEPARIRDIRVLGTIVGGTKLDA
jgi:predicted amidohydrolase YtcJ